MRRRWIWWLIGVVFLVGAPVAWYVGSPLFINRTVTEEFPMSAKATLPEGMTRTQAETELMEASKQTSAASEAMPATAVATLAKGSFTDADSFHKGSGTALVTRVGSDRVLRLEEFRVTNGPDLYVYLAVHPQPKSRAELDQGHVSLGRLKGNIGSQNYSIPESVRLESHQSVVIYCRRFHVVFSTATLRPIP